MNKKGLEDFVLTILSLFLGVMIADWLGVFR